MIRLISLLCLVSWALAAAPALAQGGPLLKPVVRVASGIVTIGDLVANAGAKSSLAVFRAPDLGETGTVSVQDVVAALAAHGLASLDTAGLDRVSVTRDSRALTLEDLRNPLTAALARDTGVEPESIDIALDGGAFAIQLPVEADGAVEIRDAVWTRDTGTFSALLSIRRIDGYDERRVISGSATEAVSILALRRDLPRGAVVTEGDIEIRRIAKPELKNEMLTDIPAAAGKELRRALREGHALRASDLTEPTLVKGSSSVTVILKSGGLTLTASAQALRDGKRGETIAVMNQQSKRVLQAVVTNFNEVTINPPRKIVSAAK